jgi:hypothetical protein
MINRLSAPNGPPVDVNQSSGRPVRLIPISHTLVDKPLKRVVMWCPIEDVGVFELCGQIMRHEHYIMLIPISFVMQPIQVSVLPSSQPLQTVKQLCHLVAKYIREYRDSNTLQRQK